MPEKAAYELERDARLEENKRILAELGLDNIRVKQTATSKKRRKTPRAPSDATPIDRPRRTRSTQNLYTEAPSPSRSSHKRKADGFDDDSDTESVDYARDLPAHASHKAVERNGRIYDPINGTSCHQCRQKTLDLKVCCTNTLASWDGQEQTCTMKMCFRCLPNRYGQDVVQAASTGSWICPKCDGTCNCSFCMKHRGLNPTGIASANARKMGFSSVQDMLAAGKTFKKAVRRAKAVTNNLKTTVTKNSNKTKTKREMLSPPTELESSASDEEEEKEEKEKEGEEQEEQEEDEEDEEGEEEEIGVKEEGEDEWREEVVEEEIEDEEKLMEEEGKKELKEEDGNEDEDIDEERDCNDGEEFSVDCIMSAHFDPTTALVFKVHWLNYGPEHDTFQEYDTVADLAAMDVFEATKPTVKWKGHTVILQDAIQWEKDGVLKKKLAAIVKTQSMSKMAKRRRVERGEVRI